MVQLTEADLSDIRDANEDWLDSLEGVIGTSIGLTRDGDLCLRVFLNADLVGTRTLIEQRLQGVPLSWEIGEVGPYVGE